MYVYLDPVTYLCAVSTVSAVECFLISVSGETPSSKTPETRHLVDRREDAKLAKLVEMGFRAEEAREALHQCQGDVEAACELLATTPSAASSSGGGSGFLSSLVRYSSTCIRMYMIIEGTLEANEVDKNVSKKVLHHAPSSVAQST